MEHLRLLRGFDSEPVIWNMNELQEATRTRLLKAVETGDIELLSRDICLCGSTIRKTISLTDRFNLPFGSYLCCGCGLIYTSPYISPVSLSAYYEHYYHDLHFGRPPSPGQALYAKGQGAKIFNLTKDRLKSNDIAALEIGSGSGSVIKEFAEAAAEYGIKVSGLGLEYDSENVACFDAEGPELTMRHGGVEDLLPSDGPFDIIIMSHVLEHFPSPEKELATLERFLKDDSFLYIEVPGVFSLRRKYKNYECDYLKYFTGAHMFNFNLYSLTHIMNLCGYSLLWGNEEVESIFAPGNQKADISGNAKLVESFIDDFETNIMFYQSVWAENESLKSEIEKLARDTANLKEDSRRLKNFLPIRIYRYLRRKKKGQY